MSKLLIIDGNSLACRAAFAYNPRYLCPKWGKWNGEWNSTKTYKKNDVVVFDKDAVYIAKKESINIAPPSLEHWDFLGSDLKNSEGKLTGATYRFINMLDKLMHQIEPTHVVVGWDVGRDTFRKEVDSTYKQTREKKNDDLYIQFADMKRILDAVGIKNVGVKGFEGDDIVGTYIQLSQADKNYIATGDKDSFQLISDKTEIIHLSGNFKDMKFITADKVFEDYGVTVDKFADLKALMGDEGDNIKGINGCGEKTAAKLINHYGTLDEIVKNANNICIKGVNKKIQENIGEWVERYEQVKQLVQIRRDVPVPYSFDQCQINFDWNNALPIFKELEFNSFIKKLNGGDFFGFSQK
jgi:DNA polymerase-1